MLCGSMRLAAADQVLFDFESGFNAQQVGTQDASVAVAKSGESSVLQVRTRHQQEWPGITLRAPDGRWDLSAFGLVALRVKNAGTNRTTVYCRVDNQGADGLRNCVTESVALNPGQSEWLRVRLPRCADSTLGGKLFGMRGYPVASGGPGTIDPTNIAQLVIFVAKPREDHAFELDDVRATGSFVSPTAWVTDAEPFFPFIDTFGQYRHKDWPGKVHSVPELQQRCDEEARALAVRPGPPDWDQYGGWKLGPTLKDTGFFRTEKVNGRWWMVDPEGRVFFSHGIDCVRMMDATPIAGRSDWFAEFPGDQPELKEFLGSGHATHGYYKGQSPKTFSFAAANLKRKYGDDWRTKAAAVAHQRLRSWGFNTIANWSDSSVMLLRRTPYTDSIGSWGVKMIEGSEGYWGKFPDVYDASFTAGLRRSMDGKKSTSANDPWCIGYFSDNEMSWGNEMSLALGALKSPPEQAAKREFIADLEKKYGGIEKLNGTWGTSHASWEALRESRTTPDVAKAREDLVAFYVKTAETYFRTVNATIKSVAPNQLYLGCRFAWVNDVAAKAAAKYCDVVSYNLYQRSVADFKYPGGDKPLIIGEFHFGALDRGMFHTGLVPTENQVARARAYHDYVLGAAGHTQIVGAHWFQWQDEPTTGRVLDEENYQIGFVDIADTPYREMVEASRFVASKLYQAAGR